MSQSKRGWSNPKVLDQIFEDGRRKIAEFEQAESEYLLENGWTEVIVGGLKLWQRNTRDGKVIVEKTTALHLQQNN